MDSLKQSIQERAARVAVIGQGYVGLPLSMAFSQAGYSVLGVEADPEVALLNRGESFIPDIPTAALREALSRGYHDPHVPSLPWHYGGLQSRPLSPETLAETDCAVLLTDHSQLNMEMLVRYSPAVLDTRNALRDFPR